MGSLGDRRATRIVPYPGLRRVIEMTQRSAMTVPMIHGFVEFDVTEAQRRLRAHEARTGEKLSFTGFMVFCLGQAVAADRSVQALHKGYNKLEIFDDVDVSLPVERDFDGWKQPVIAIIRAADKKSYLDIHREIRAAQAAPVAEVWEGFTRFSWMPPILMRLLWPLFWWRVRRDPEFQRAFGGTVGISAVGMFAKGAGWALPIANRTQLTLGGIASKPAVVDGQIEIRDMLSVTLSFDHAIIDGGNAARFTDRLRQLVESAAGLEQVEGSDGAGGSAPGQASA
jgi:pyruvate/2-oxoglutarate dehydrogenase complex dihydrolipoamide acyltransferase (E2) component